MVNGGETLGGWSYVDLMLHAHLLELGGLRRNEGGLSLSASKSAESVLNDFKVWRR